MFEIWQDHGRVYVWQENVGDTRDMFKLMSVCVYSMCMMGGWEGTAFISAAEILTIERKEEFYVKFI